MHRHASRFVNDEQVRVFEYDGEFGAGNGLRARFLGDADRWNAHHIALCQAVQLVDSALVDTHLARTQDAVDMTLRYAFADTQQVVIDALSGVFFADRHELRLQSLL